MSNTDTHQLPEDLRAVAEYLRHARHGLKLRAGILESRRVVYFKGSSALRALLHPAFDTHNIPSLSAITTEDDAIALMSRMMDHGIFIPVTPDANQPHAFKLVAANPSAQFSASRGTRYVWLYASATHAWYTYGVSAALFCIGVFLATFTAWPHKIQLVIAYAPLAFVVLTVAAAAAQWAILCCSRRCMKDGRGVLLFPRLHDDIDPIRSFWPLWGWHDPVAEERKKQRRKKKKRSAEEWARGAVPTDMRFDLSHSHGAGSGTSTRTGGVGLTATTAL